jgi:hypothetical protein
MEYDEFYNLYPRKHAKALGLVMWNRLTEEEKKLALEALPKHVKMWEKENRSRNMIPLPASWLNPVLGRRWEDEIITSEPQSSPWWLSVEATMSYGRSKGVPARPGEDMAGYRQRLRAA